MSLNAQWMQRDLAVLWHPCTQMKDHETLPLIPIRRGDGDKLEAWFTRTRAIRRSIIAEGQDDPAPDFGRKH